MNDPQNRDSHASEIPRIGGGQGEAAAPSRPDLLVSAPGGIALTTPAHTVVSAGNTLSVAAPSIDIVAQRNIAVAAQGGISLFSAGQPPEAERPVQQTGLQLHAASGSVSVQAQASTLQLAADQNVEIASTTDSVRVTSPLKVLLSAGGSALVIDSSGIQLITPGIARFDASMKELGGPASASAPAPDLPKAQDLAGCLQARQTAAAAQSGVLPLQ